MAEAHVSKLRRSPTVIVIGAGPSGICIAHEMKHNMGFDDFMIYEKLDGPGGTWRANNYPGCGCDIPTHLYSFSFELKPDWSKELCDQKEILEYMENTVDKYNLRPHMRFGIECMGARWSSDIGQWEVTLRDLKTNIEYSRYATALVSAVGGISFPRDVKFKGMEKFQGKIFHTARWNHDFDYTGKKMAVIGNGCSAAQVVPALLSKAACVKQYARSPQWYHERPNRPFTNFEKWCFKHIPFWLRWQRLRLFLESDNLVSTYMPGPAAAKVRERVETQAKEYIHATAPEKYHDFIVPKFPLGCKRRIFDPGYLQSLHASNIEVIPEGIKEITETGIISDSGVEHDFDAIVLATGFQVQQFLTPMEIVGSSGVSLRRQWEENRGAQAFLGTTGPNTFPAHNSVLFTCEVQVGYLARTILAPLIDRRVSIIDVKETRENVWVSDIHQQLQGSVFSAGCSNWYINEFGRNSASFPGYARNFWVQTWMTANGLDDYDVVKAERIGWVFRLASRWLRIWWRTKRRLQGEGAKWRE
ncbi:hypothetical protein DIZ76_011300 [Coccidioides immitis]|nr:hypothetical protein DIZ76_011300 [Coccidioides immitis]